MMRDGTEPHANQCPFQEGKERREGEEGTRGRRRRKNTGKVRATKALRKIGPLKSNRKKSLICPPHINFISTSMAVFGAGRACYRGINRRGNMAVIQIENHPIYPRRK